MNLFDKLADLLSSSEPRNKNQSFRRTQFRVRITQKQNERLLDRLQQSREALGADDRVGSPPVDKEE